MEYGGGNRLFSLPGIGPSREFQEKVRKTILLWQEYQDNSREFQMAFAELGKLALDRLGEKISGIAAAGKKITSLKQIYALWVDANEEVFAQFACNEDYSRLYGGLVNSLMAFRRQANEVLDEILSLLNMPTLKSMNTLYKRQHDMANALRGGRDAQRHMEQELAELRAALGKKQARPAASGQARKAGTTRPARKKKKRGG
jgi:class III poly(R)-hydroxyalkanoic acid synthase PhaE subunit